MGHGIRLSEIVEKMDLKNLTPEVDTSETEVHIPDVNRPALQLAGFFDHFDSNRVQIIGNVEYTYVETLTDERRREIYDRLLRSHALYSAGICSRRMIFLNWQNSTECRCIRRQNRLQILLRRSSAG